MTRKYEIVATTRHGDEVIEEDVETKQEAEYLLREYRLAYRGTGIAVRRRNAKVTKGKEE